MKRWEIFLFIAIGIIAGIALVYSCGGGDGADSNGARYTQADFTGTWKGDTQDGARYITLDDQGNVIDVIPNKHEIIYDFGGEISVVDSDGTVSGYVYLDHSHSLYGSKRHSHPIDYSGIFSSYDLITGSWMVAEAGTGDFRWSYFDYPVVLKKACTPPHGSSFDANGEGKIQIAFNRSMADYSDECCSFPSGTTSFITDGTKFEITLDAQLNNGRTYTVRLNCSDTSLDDFRDLKGNLLMNGEEVIYSFTQSGGPEITFPAEYWFGVHNVVANSQIQRITDMNLTWGSITFNAPDAVSGIGTYHLEGNLPFAEGGVAVHEHNLVYWDSTEPGYIDGPADAAIVGTFILDGTHLMFAPPDGEEGYFTEDGKTLIMRNRNESGYKAFFVKKPLDFDNNDLIGKWISIGPYTQLEYIPSGYNTLIATNFGLQVMDPDAGNILWWDTQFRIVNLSDITQPLEDVEWETEVDFSAFSIGSDGFFEPPDPGLFWTFGSGGTFVTAGNAEEITDGEHVLETRFGMKVHDSPTLAMVAGTWELAVTAYMVLENADGWGSGDEVSGLVSVFGQVGISDDSFSFAGSLQDVYTDLVEDDFWSADITGPYTEYMVINQEISTSPIGSAIAIPLFHVTEPGHANSIIFRAVINGDENVMIMWSPIDEDDIPVDEDAGSSQIFLGVAVKTY